MADFILLMHDDAAAVSPTDWEPYIKALGAALQGGSAIGGGLSLRKTGEPAGLSTGITGFVRIAADDLAHARRLLTGNPVFEAGGTVEIRELPRTG